MGPKKRPHKATTTMQKRERKKRIRKSTRGNKRVNEGLSKSQIKKGLKKKGSPLRNEMASEARLIRRLSR